MSRTSSGVAMQRDIQQNDWNEPETYGRRKIGEIELHHTLQEQWGEGRRREERRTIEHNDYEYMLAHGEYQKLVAACLPLDR